MPLRITLRQLEYFVAVGECGSVALAAERVNVSSPSISTAIAQLEAEFGLQLFVRRHAQGLSLTQGGARFLEHARGVLAHARGLGDLANEITGAVRGPLNVGCLLTFAQIVLPQLRRSFAKRWPEVAFHQFERDQQELFDGLRAARLDIALSYDLNIPPDLSFVPLIDLRIALGQAEPAYDASTVVIILIFAHGATGIVVDRVADVVPLAPAQLKPPPQLHGSAMAGHVTAIGSLDERMLIVLDMNSLLAGLGVQATGKLAA